jgi:hypothetical protein
MGSPRKGNGNAHCLISRAKDRSPTIRRKGKPEMNIDSSANLVRLGAGQPSGEGLTKKMNARAEAWGTKGHSYKPLAVQFRHHGFTYRQIAREGNTAMYEQTWNGCDNPTPCYEVIRIRRRVGFRIGDRFVEPAEIYPNSEAWGIDGFTLTDKDAAFAKLREIGTK